MRDDASTLKVCLDSIRPHVDELICLDTGSTDNSPDIARQCGADKVDFFVGCNDQNNQIADFALARNYALGLASNPVHFWADADDVVLGAENLRPLVASRPAEAVMWLIPYEYQHDAQGRVVCLHHRENLVTPTSGFEWKTPVHEVLVTKPGTAPAIVPAPNVRRVHRKQHSTRKPDPQRNLRILRNYIQRVGEGDVRSLYYLGIEYSNHQMIGKAFRTLRRYVQLSNWSDEKCLAILETARLYQALDDHELAIEWAQRAMLTKSWPEPYWTIAESFYELANDGVNSEDNYRRAAHFGELGLSLPDTETVLFVNPKKRHEIKAVLSVCYFKLGQMDRALDTARQGLEALPENEILQNNVRYFETRATQGRLIADLNRLYQLGAISIEQGNQAAGALFGGGYSPTLMPTVPQLPPMPEVPATMQATADGCFDVAFFVGPGVEAWNPDTLARGGMGGSETMAWELAKRLRAIGHRVRIFGHCDATAPEGVFDGVEFLDARRYPGTVCEVLICSRRPTAIDDEFGVKAKVRLLYVHDVHAGPELDPRRALRFDRVLSLSQWHRDFLRQVYPLIDPEKILVTRNGIDVERFAQKNQGCDDTLCSCNDLAEIERRDREKARNPRRVIYSSSPDRGLPCLLEMWPTVLEAVPDAELHVYYGWKTWEVCNELGGDTEGAAILQRIKLMAGSMPSVKLRGRVSGTELAKEMLQAGVWTLPGGFCETSCIGAAEAQAAGLHVVCSDNAALKETVADRGQLIGGFTLQQDRHPPPQPEAYKREFAEALILAIAKAEQGPADSSWVRENWSLDGLAKDWDGMFRTLVADVEERVMPRFWSAL